MAHSTPPKEGRGDWLVALKWCRDRRYCMARYLATRARAMRPVRLPGGAA